MRLFIATDLPPVVYEWAIQQRDALKQLLPTEPRLRWTDPAGWHVTLQFLGEQPESQGVKIIESMKRAAEGVGPFTISLNNPGTFMSSRGAVLWLGVQSGTEPLTTMARRLDSSKPLRAHATLARSNARIDTGLLKTFQPKSPCPSGCITQIHLYESVIGPTGATYTKLQSTSLK